MLSYTCKVAIKAVIYLSAKSAKNEKSSMRHIAENINASEHTLGKILQTLARHRLINSVKGPSGGFYLTENQQKQPVLHIIETIEGKEVFKECGLGLTRCSEVRPCPIHHEYKVARNMIEDLFSKKRVKDLRDSVSNGLAHLN